MLQSILTLGLQCFEKGKFNSVIIIKLCPAHCSRFSTFECTVMLKTTAVHCPVTDLHCCSRRLVDGAEKDFERRKMGETVGEPVRSFLQRPLHFYYQLATSSSSTLSNSDRYSKWIKWGFYPDSVAKIWPMENLKELVDPAQMQWPAQSSLFMDNLSRFYFHLRPSSALKCTKVFGLKTR